MRKISLTHFSCALDFHLARRNFDYRSLQPLVDASCDARWPSRSSWCRNLYCWRRGITKPTQSLSFVMLAELEKHLHLRKDYFAKLIPRLSPTEQAIRKTKTKEQGIVRWHLPVDFDSRPEPERITILNWISENVLSGNTEFGRYQKKRSQIKYSVVFPTLPKAYGGRPWMGSANLAKDALRRPEGCSTVPATPMLAAEMQDLIDFKTASLAPKGFRRYLRWNAATAAVSTHRFGYLFGALAAAANSPAQGFDVPLDKLTFGLLVFPNVWDWYLHWCERRRGFFSVAEGTILYDAKSLTCEPTGWLRQHSELRFRLNPIDGLVSVNDIQRAQNNWTKACDDMCLHSIFRRRELRPIMRMHRDPFTPILPILASPNPLRLYVKIAREIVRLMPDRHKDRLNWACAVRNYLMFRFAVHLGVRQRNLRELLIRLPDERNRSLTTLEELHRGELRWNMEQGFWEVFIPASAFKNGYNSFFKGRPYQLTLPNIQSLYKWIAIYLGECRSILLKECCSDPGTFFVRHPAKSGHYNPELDIFSFYDTWTDTIKRYGIQNPYTGRGAIKGLLPHGPHCVRDILATHLLKRTGSYELASFAIQDQIGAVMRHYSRFLPHEKLERAAKELNKAWH